MSCHGNIDKGQAVNYNDPFEQFPTWMNITPITTADTLFIFLLQVSVLDKPSAHVCLQRKNDATPRHSLPSQVFCFTHCFPQIHYFALFYLLSACAPSLSVTYFLCPSFLPQHMTPCNLPFVPELAIFPSARVLVSAGWVYGSHGNMKKP